MKKSHIVSLLLSISGTSMIVIALIIIGLTDKNSFISYTGDQILTTSMKYTSASTIKEVNMETSPNASLDIAPAVQGDLITKMTVKEIGMQLNKHLGTDLLMNKGELIASYAISLQVDPFIVAAIMLHETGCGSRCSGLVRACNNVAGQKGSPACGGSYKGYASIDDGIKGAIDNLYRNYYAKGYNTVEKIGPKYAESNTWVSKINSYVAKLKS